jgi:hypothetical protein
MRPLYHYGTIERNNIHTHCKQIYSMIEEDAYAHTVRMNTLKRPCKTDISGSAAPLTGFASIAASLNASINRANI